MIIRNRFSHYLYHINLTILQVKPALIRAETELDVSYVPLTTNEWNIMTKVADYLKPFADLTKFGSDETACISQVRLTEYYILIT